MLVIFRMATINDLWTRINPAAAGVFGSFMFKRASVGAAPP